MQFEVLGSMNNTITTEMVNLVLMSASSPTCSPDIASLPIRLPHPLFAEANYPPSNNNTNIFQFRSYQYKNAGLSPSSQYCGLR